MKRTAEQPAGSSQPQQKLRHVGQCLYRSTQSKVYYGIACVGKRQVKKSLKTKDAQMAKRRLAEFRAKVGNLKPDEMSKRNFKLLATRWLEELRQIP
jgi:hypothetical protein